MASDAGYQLRWADVDPAENVAVSPAAMADPDGIVPLLERIFVPASAELPIDVLRLSRPDPPTIDEP